MLTAPVCCRVFDVRDGLFCSLITRGLCWVDVFRMFVEQMHEWQVLRSVHDHDGGAAAAADDDDRCDSVVDERRRVDDDDARLIVDRHERSQCDVKP